MPITAKILADSVAPCAARLTTFECTYPRSIHSEIMTHRMLSKNSASSRAIPTPKLIERVMEDPFIPNQKGMQAGAELSEKAREDAVADWLAARDAAVTWAKHLHEIGVHKQVVNRIVEPWMWITVIISGTEWDNFFGLRCHKDAEPHFQELATKMRDARYVSAPRELKAGEWHLPLISGEDWTEAFERLGFIPDADDVNEFQADATKALIKVSVGRCARVSYLTHDGKRDIQADIDLHDRLMVQEPLHASPAEHVAQALDWPEWYKFREGRFDNPPQLRSAVALGHRVGATGHGPAQDALALAHLTSGNFLGFRQYRKTLDRENIGGRML